MTRSSPTSWRTSSPSRASPHATQGDGAGFRRGLPAGGCAGLLIADGLAAQVPFARLREAASEPHNWLTYSGGYFSQRYSELDQITPANVGDLELQWVYQTPVFGPWQATPIVVDGVMYVSQRPNDIVALDARTGRVFWVYSYPTPSDHRACCGSNNRGVAVLGDRVFMGTLDAHVVAIDASTGAELWNVEVADKHLAYSLTLAPLAVKDKVIVGIRRRGPRHPRVHRRVRRRDGRGGVAVLHHPRGRVSRATRRGNRARRIRRRTATRKRGRMVARPRGLPGHTTGARPHLLGHGQPRTRLQPRAAAGRQSVFEFGGGARRRYRENPLAFPVHAHDPYDYDSVQIPVLADIERGGTLFKVMLWANRNGFYYVLDRATGRFLTGLPFVEVNWAEGLDDSGRPVETPQPPARRPIRACRAAPTGTRRRTVRGRSCSTSRPGRTMPRCSTARRRSTSKANTLPAA